MTPAAHPLPNMILITKEVFALLCFLKFLIPNWNDNLRIIIVR